MATFTGLTDKQQAILTFVSSAFIAISALPTMGLDPGQRFMVAAAGVIGLTLKEFLGSAPTALVVTSSPQKPLSSKPGDVVTAQNQAFDNGQEIAPIGSTFTTGLNSAGNTVYFITTPDGHTVKTVFKPIN